MTYFINIDDRYGDAFSVELRDYEELNPEGEFEERYGGIYEYQDGEWLQIAETESN